ncbi:MAG: ATP/GTP-binding protein [Bdellovibrionota bacterium]
MKNKLGTKIVLTGGPCAGKTTMVKMIEQAFPASVVGVPEAASLLFNGGFPRFQGPEAICAVQRAIFSVQHELEVTYLVEYPEKALVLDRGVIDGAAYWPEGPENFFAALGTSFEAELARYDKVIYLTSAAESDYLLHKGRNPNRKEDWQEAQRLDALTLSLWRKHPNFTLIANNRSFQRKVMEVLGAFSESFSFEAGNEKK